MPVLNRSGIFHTHFRNPNAYVKKLKMNQKALLAKILSLDPKKKIIKSLLSDPELGESLKSSLSEIETLKEKMASIIKEIKNACKSKLKINPEIIFVPPGSFETSLRKTAIFEKTYE